MDTCVRCTKPILPDSRPNRKTVPNRRRSRSRGLCSPCYVWARYHDCLIDYPRITRSRDELLDDYVVLRRQGYDWKNCAKKLGMNYSAFERALYRARAAGDDRARRLNEKELETAR